MSENCGYCGCVGARSVATAAAVVDSASDVATVVAAAAMATPVHVAVVTVVTIALASKADELAMTDVAVVTVMGAEVGVADEAGLFAM
jgi:hypothetical protein